MALPKTSLSIIWGREAPSERGVWPHARLPASPATHSPGSPPTPSPHHAVLSSSLVGSNSLANFSHTCRSRSSTCSGGDDRAAAQEPQPWQRVTAAAVQARGGSCGWGAAAAGKQQQRRTTRAATCGCVVEPCHAVSLGDHVSGAVRLAGLPSGARTMAQRRAEKLCSNDDPALRAQGTAPTTLMGVQGSTPRGGPHDVHTGCPGTSPGDTRAAGGPA